MHYLRLLGLFARTSFQEEAAYRANFILNLIYSLLNLGTGVLGVGVIFNQIPTVNGWDFNGTLVLLGVYLTVGALRNLVIGPSLDSLAGMDGEVWSGRGGFSPLPPGDTPFPAGFPQMAVVLPVRHGARIARVPNFYYPHCRTSIPCLVVAF